MFSKEDVKFIAVEQFKEMVLKNPKIWYALNFSQVKICIAVATVFGKVS